MRLTKPLIAMSVAGAFALAACGGSGSGGSSDEPAAPDSRAVGDESKLTQDPTRVDGPVEIEGAVAGGTVRVIAASGLNTMDPSEAYYQNTTSILTGLVTRSLTDRKSVV